MVAERYGDCKKCKGAGYIIKREPPLFRNEKKECSCMTGDSGDAMDYLANEQKKDWEHERRLP